MNFEPYLWVFRKIFEGKMWMFLSSSSRILSWGKGQVARFLLLLLFPPLVSDSLKEGGRKGGRRWGRGKEGGEERERGDVFAPFWFLWRHETKFLARKEIQDGNKIRCMKKHKTQLVVSVFKGDNC